MLREAAATHRPFDIALIDHQMPDLDGCAIARLIKADPTICDSVLVLLSSQDQVADSRKLRKLGFAGYLLKPIRECQLFATLV
jgi:CheY-like chemotaxis protein